MRGRVKTFYLAMPSHRRSAARARAAELQALGLSWHNDHDWTDDVFWKPDRSPEFLGAVAEDDIAAACDCNLFVACLDLEDEQGCRTSRGLHMEIGARLADCEEVHLVGTPPPHTFFHHPGVHQHETWAAFMAWLRRVKR